jgi:hypothetical protein
VLCLLNCRELFTKLSTHGGVTQITPREARARDHEALPVSIRLPTISLIGPRTVILQCATFSGPAYPYGLYQKATKLLHASEVTLELPSHANHELGCAGTREQRCK